MNVVKSSAETMEAVCNVGLAKSKMTFSSNLILAFLAGAYIGFGSLLALRIAGGLPLDAWGSMQRLVFGGVFPCGLLLVLLAGADLFTGDCMFMPSGVAKHGVGLDKFFRILILAWIGNLIGSVVLAWLGQYSGLMNDPATARYAVGVANGKVALPFGVAFVRGIFCNWLVCLAIYMALSASDGVSKAVLLWPPITAFVALGFEHSVANMTFVPLGIFIGSSESYAALVADGAPALTATWSGLFVNNLIPVTLGNFIGGAVFVGLAYYVANGLKKA
ncbi:MAG: formate/nitrite transporter family protein [Deltaproteobacteria bacterium]|jgi:formate/nitrite transporter|nr:formate/nitrite transporter family protein [Deltaproteobacteria bacterium]